MAKKSLIEKEKKKQKLEKKIPKISSIYEKKNKGNFIFG